MPPTSLNVVNDRLLLVRDQEELHKLRGTAARALADTLEAFRREGRGFERSGEETPNDIVGEELHAAIGVVNDEELSRSEELVADNERTDGVVRGATTSITYDMCITFGKASVLGGVEARPYR